MKKVTIITGGQGNGKTRKAIELADGRVFYHVNGFSHTKETYIHDLIIIDLCVPKPKELSELKSFLSTEKSKLRMPFTEDQVEVDRPEVIICWTGVIPEDLLRLALRLPNVEFFNL